MDTLIDEIRDSLKKGQGKRIANLVKLALDEGISPRSIVEDGFLAGMSQVGDVFRSEEVGVPEILSVTRALDKGVEALKRYAGASGVKNVGTVVLGTMKGDMHDIGKKLVKMMMESRNIHVIDLGVDVSPARFYEETMASHAQIVCMSGILSQSARDMRAVIEEFEDKGERDSVYFMTGGYSMDEKKAQEIGADCYTKDACECAERAYKYLTKKEKKKKKQQRDYEDA